MLTDQEAQYIAAQWHGGGGSALYVLASTGAITDDLPMEVAKLRASLSLAGPGKAEHAELTSLIDYIAHHWVRPAVPDWYERVIKKAQA